MKALLDGNHKYNVGRHYEEYIERIFQSEHIHIQYYTHFKQHQSFISLYFISERWHLLYVLYI